jgi:predicted ABC-type ATPase
MQDPNYDTRDICNISRIYTADYQYFLSPKELEELMSGKAIAHPCKYSTEEQKNLQEDIQDIYRTTISEYSAEKSSARPIAIMTAGASGAGKTTLLKQKLDKHKSWQNDYVYLCCDETCLKNQIRTYQKDLQNCDRSLSSQQNIFNKWRPSSHAILHLILGNLIREKKSFYLGSTCTESYTEQLFQFLKKNGYQIQILYVATPDSIRWQSIQERNKTFVHGFSSTEEGTKEHALHLAQQVHTFPVYADEITFYYRKSLQGSVNLAARWTNQHSLQIFSPDDYTEIKKIHNSVIKTLKRPDLNWENFFSEK